MELSELQEYANLYLNGIPSYRIRQEKTGVAARCLPGLYREMIAGIGESAGARAISPPEWKGGASREVIGPFRDAFSGLSGTLILMGSLSDGTATGYSDLDAVYFPPDEEFVESFGEIRRALLRATRVVLSFDHLQHHGVFVVPESIARSCSPLPASAFQGAVVLAGKPGLKLGGWEDFWKTNFFPIVNKCLALAENPGKRPRNLYGIKLFLSQLMLLPSLFLLAGGQDIHKAESFGVVKGMFGEVCGALDVATELRASWKRPRSRLFEMGVNTWPSPWDFAFAFRRFFRSPESMTGKLNNEFYEGAARLARRMKDALDI